MSSWNHRPRKNMNLQILFINHIMIISLVVFGIVVVIGILLVFRSQNRSSKLLPFLGWVGGILGCCSFLLIPWITNENYDTILTNAQWLVSQTEILDTINQFPEIQDQFPMLRALEAEEVINMIAEELR